MAVFHWLYTEGMRFGFLITFALTLTLPVAAVAQSLGGVGSTDSFTFSLSPQYPTPHSQATLSFVSGSVDLANATVAVSVAGKNIYNGSVQPLAIALGGAGSLTTIKVIVTSNATNYSQTLTVQPQDVALVVEPISSAPPLYPGKSLVPLEGSVRVVAVAHVRSAGGKVFDPSALSYTWTIDGTQIINSSGIGKETVIVASPLQYRARKVSVAVTSQDGNLAGGASLSLTDALPSVRIYENDPLLGILYDRALSGAFTIRGAEVTLYAAPFSLPTTNGTPLMQWFLNGTAAQTGNFITLRPTGSGKGNASLSLVASSDTSTKVTTNLSLLFGATAGSNFFGL